MSEFFRNISEHVARWMFTAFATPWPPLVVAALGMLSIYLLLADRRPGRPTDRRLATVLGSLAIAGLILWMAAMQMRRTYTPPPNGVTVLQLQFYLFFAISLSAAARGIADHQPIRCVVFLSIAVMSAGVVLLLVQAKVLGVAIMGFSAATALPLLAGGKDARRVEPAEPAPRQDARLSARLRGLAVVAPPAIALGWAIRSLVESPGPIRELAMRQEHPPPAVGARLLLAELFSWHGLAPSLVAVMLLIAVVILAARARRQ